MTRKWRLIIDDAQNAWQNMATDVGLFEEIERGIRLEPTLRLYLWKPWAVSLGQAQPLAEVLDVDALRAKGYDWVRRPTGGRAVFHAQEITYAFVGPARGLFAKGHRTHERIGKALLRFYKHLGIAASLTQPATPEELKPKSPAPCFLAPGLAEIHVDGRKLAGSAQRRGRDAFLQHGSILLGPRHMQIAEFTPLPPAKQQRLKEAMLRSSACVTDFLKKPPSTPKLMRLLARAFAEEFGCEWR